jgi:hypothetical protein
MGSKASKARILLFLTKKKQKDFFPCAASAERQVCNKFAAASQAL